MSPRLRTVVIKPTLRCTANCLGCASRRELHKSVAKEKLLTFEDWQKVLADAASVGMRRLVISGGEPTLGKDLHRLIAEGRKHCDSVSMNTNGSLITEDLVESLIEAGLTTVMISLYSHEADIHNTFRQSKNLFEKATRAIRIFAAARERHPEFILRTQAIILRENYRTLDDLVRLHHELGSQRLNISYLEGDFGGKYLLTEKEIAGFREHTVPRMLSLVGELDLPEPECAESVIQGLYGAEAGDPKDLAKGIYWKDKPCRHPKHFTILLADGEVHPCNIVEYTHHPVMGNLLEKSLRRIHHSFKWWWFRKRRFEECQYCPMHLHASLRLR